jgi:hypothetical protein
VRHGIVVVVVVWTETPHQPADIREWLLTRLTNLSVCEGIKMPATMMNTIMAIRPSVVTGVISPNPTVARACSKQHP